MAVISFSEKPEQIWCVAGWAFRQVLDDVSARYPNDVEMIKKFEMAKTAYDGLIIPMLEPSFGERVTKAIRTVVTGILSGTLQSGIVAEGADGKRILEQYRQAIRELLHAIPPESTE